MACHNLSDKYRRPAILFGSAGAIVLRIILTIFAVARARNVSLEIHDARAQRRWANTPPKIGTGSSQGSTTCVLNDMSMICSPAAEALNPRLNFASATAHGSDVTDYARWWKMP